MKSFTMGVIACGVAIAGIGCIMSDKTTKRKMINTGRKFAGKAEDIMDGALDRAENMW